MTTPSVSALGSRTRTAGAFNALSAFLPSSISMRRDGGTLRMRGLLNKSVSGTVRVDGRYGSPTRGQFFIATHRMGQDRPERPLTRDDLRALRQAMDKFFRSHPTHSREYDDLSRRLNEALGVGPTAPSLRHSTLTNVEPNWSPGSGVAPPFPGFPQRRWGLYLSANVRTGHQLHIDGVTVNNARKTLTIEVDARGSGKPGSTRESQEQFVRGGFSLQAERWTVVVKDGEKVVSQRQMMLGGPPAPAVHR